VNTTAVVLVCVGFALALAGIAAVGVLIWQLRRKDAVLSDTAAELASAQAKATRDAAERGAELAKGQAQDATQKAQEKELQEVRDGHRTLDDVLRDLGAGKPANTKP